MATFHVWQVCQRRTRGGAGAWCSNYSRSAWQYACFLTADALTMQDDVAHAQILLEVLKNDNTIRLQPFW